MTINRSFQYSWLVKLVSLSISLSNVVNIPEKIFPLSNANKSLLCKDLNFVPVSNKLDEFSVKQDVEKFSSPRSALRLF